MLTGRTLDSMSQKTIVTCEEFERIAAEIGPCELIDGAVVKLSPSGYDHSVITGNIYSILREFVHTKKLGRALTNEIGVHIQRDLPRSRGADVAFLSNKKLPRGKKYQGFLTIPPELIVEVLGEECTWTRIEEKVADYHKLGVDMVWVVDPFTRAVKKFPRIGKPEVVHDGAEIDGGKILPGFKVPVARFFEED
jgi:Uma2 family endonuclease